VENATFVEEEMLTCIGTTNIITIIICCYLYFVIKTEIIHAKLFEIFLLLIYFGSYN
jgi:hypothetical protein